MCLLRVFVSGLSLAWASHAFGQKRFSWQDYCFKNPAAPVCKANDYAVKPQPRAKDAAPRTVVTHSSPSTPKTVTPSVIVIGKIDWHFADPFADALVGINCSGLTASPLARDLISEIGAKSGLTDVDVQKILDGLSGIDQATLSVHNNRVVVMITGSVAGSALPAPEAGLKAVPVAGGAMLLGHVDEVDQALARMAAKGPLNELMQRAEAWQTASEFWVTGSAVLVGPDAVRAGIKRFSLTVAIRDRLSSDLALEFFGVPSAVTLKALQSKLGVASLEGSTLHARSSLDAIALRQKFAEITGGPLGAPLTALVEAARYLPARDPSVPKRTHPVIYGLDGGPREVTGETGR